MTNQNALEALLKTLDPQAYAEVESSTQEAKSGARKVERPVKPAQTFKMVALFRKENEVYYVKHCSAYNSFVVHRKRIDKHEAANWEPSYNFEEITTNKFYFVGSKKSPAEHAEISKKYAQMLADKYAKEAEAAHIKGRPYEAKAEHKTMTAEMRAALDSRTPKEALAAMNIRWLINHKSLDESHYLYFKYDFDRATYQIVNPAALSVIDMAIEAYEEKLEQHWCNN